MTRIRTVSLVLLAILLAGCVTPSGIVDNFVPPQGQPVASKLRTPTCEEAIAQDPAAGDVKTLMPCVAEIIGGPANSVPRPNDQRRPRPPRMRR